MIDFERLLALCLSLLLLSSGLGYEEVYTFADDYFDNDSSTSPSAIPTKLPSLLPSLLPTGIPSENLSSYPTQEPMHLPTQSPTEFPSSRPSPHPDPNCQVGVFSGNYGNVDVTNNNIVSRTVKYDYQMTVKSDNQDSGVLNDLEKGISNSILASGKIFDGCHTRKIRKRVLLQSTKSFSESLQGRQLVESGKIVGLKSKPSDSVTSDLCTNHTDSSESTCVVIEGRLKFFYKNSTMSEDELKESEAVIQSVIKKGMEDGTLKRANAAIIELVYIPKIDADAVVNPINSTIDDGDNSVDTTQTLNGVNLPLIMFATCGTLVFILLGAIKYRQMKRKIVDDFVHLDDSSMRSVTSSQLNQKAYRTDDIYENDLEDCSEGTQDRKINRTDAVDELSQGLSFSTEESDQSDTKLNYNKDPYNQTFVPNVMNNNYENTIDDSSITTPVGIQLLEQSRHNGPTTCNIESSSPWDEN